MDLFLFDVVFLKLNGFILSCRSESVKKPELKETLYIRKLKPSLYKRKRSELFTLIIRDAQKYLKPKHIDKFQNLRSKFHDTKLGS